MHYYYLLHCEEASWLCLFTGRNYSFNTTIALHHTFFVLDLPSREADRNTDNEEHRTRGMRIAIHPLRPFVTSV